MGPGALPWLAITQKVIVNWSSVNKDGASVSEQPKSPFEFVAEYDECVRSTIDLTEQPRKTRRDRALASFIPTVGEDNNLFLKRLRYDQK
jgi:hypothetical protein